MSRSKRGGPGHGRGLPASRLPGRRPERSSQGLPSDGPAPESGLPGADELRDHLQRTLEATARPRSYDLVVTGTVSRADVETGPLVITDADGATWELVLPDGWSVEADPRALVTVSGDLLDEVSSTQVGPRLRVRALSRAD